MGQKQKILLWEWERGWVLCVLGSHSFPSKSDIYEWTPIPLLFTKVIPNTFTSSLCHLCGVDSAVCDQTSANNPLYCCNAGKETSEGKNRKTTSACMTSKKCWTTLSLCAYGSLILVLSNLRQGDEYDWSESLWSEQTDSRSGGILTQHDKLSADIPM